MYVKASHNVPSDIVKHKKDDNKYIRDLTWEYRAFE